MKRPFCGSEQYQVCRAATGSPRILCICLQVDGQMTNLEISGRVSSTCSVAVPGCDYDAEAALEPSSICDADNAPLYQMQDGWIGTSRGGTSVD